MTLNSPVNMGSSIFEEYTLHRLKLPNKLFVKLFALQQKKRQKRLF